MKCQHCSAGSGLESVWSWSEDVGCAGNATRDTALYYCPACGALSGMTGRDSPNPERCFEEWWLHGSPRQVEKLLRETDAARPVAERLREHYAGRTDVYPPFLTSDPGPGAARSPLAPIPSTACLLPLGLALLLGLAGLVWFVRFLLS